MAKKKSHKKGSKFNVRGILKAVAIGFGAAAIIRAAAPGMAQGRLIPGFAGYVLGGLPGGLAAAAEPEVTNMLSTVGSSFTGALGGLGGSSGGAGTKLYG